MLTGRRSPESQREQHLPPRLLHDPLEGGEGKQRATPWTDEQTAAPVQCQAEETVCWLNRIKQCRSVD